MLFELAVGVAVVFQRPDLSKFSLFQCLSKFANLICWCIIQVHSQRHLSAVLKAMTDSGQRESHIENWKLFHNIDLQLMNVGDQSLKVLCGEIFLGILNLRICNKIQITIRSINYRAKKQNKFFRGRAILFFKTEFERFVIFISTE